MTNEKFYFLSWAAPLAKLFLVPVSLWLIGRNFWNIYPSNFISVNIFLISLAFIFNQIALSLFAARMRIMLKVFGINISSVQSLRIHLQSVLYFFVLPMTVGLEAARFAKVKHIVGSNAKALTLGSALLADRLIGAIAAFILAAILLPFINLKLMPKWSIYSTFALVIGCGGLILISNLCKGSRNYFHEVRKLICCGQKGLWLSLVLSISTNLVFAFGVYLAVIAANLEITFIQTLFCLSVAMLFVIIPISFAGVSPVEGATFGVLLSLGIPVEQALIFVFISYGVKLIAAFEGAGWEVYESGRFVFRLLPEVNKDKL